jgi:FkbM family methyltransferase
MKIPWKASFTLSCFNSSTYASVSNVISNPLTYYLSLVLNGLNDFYQFKFHFKTGHELPINRFMSTYIFTELFIHKCYDEALESLSSSSPRLLEVGGNTGMFSLRTKLLFPDARIISYEPEPANYRVFNDLIQSNRLNDIELRQEALGTSNGKIHLNINKKNLGGHSIVDDFGGESIEVALSSFNELIIQEKPFDLIKLDCEGAEEQILLGLEPMVAKKIKKIIFESGVPKKRLQMIHSKLKALGYTIKSSRGLFIASR